MIATEQPPHARPFAAGSLPEKSVLASRLPTLEPGLIWFRIGPLLVVTTVAAVCWWLGPAGVRPLETLPWLLALVIIGLPHGAADLAVLRAELAPGRVWTVFGLYVAGMAVVLAGLVVAPVTALAGFLIISLWHFGHAEAAASGCGTPALVAGSVARGGLVVGLPLWAWPQATAEVTTHLLALLAPARAAAGLPVVSPSWLPPGQIELAGLALIGLSGFSWLLEIVVSAMQPTRAGLRRTLTDLAAFALLGLLGLTAPPLVSVGVFFLAWHAWRQLPVVAARLAPAAAARPVEQIVRVHRAALPLLIPAWLALGSAWWLLAADHSLRDLALLSLLVYLVVTPSHELLCGLIEAVQKPAISR